MEKPYVEWCGQERVLLKIPYSMEKKDETMILAASDCRATLLCYGKGKGNINKLSGTDFYPGSSYTRTHETQTMQGTGSHRRMVTVHHFDKFSILKVEGNRVEYAVMSTIDDKPHQWKLNVTVGKGRSPRGSPVVELEFLNGTLPQTVPCFCCCCTSWVKDCIRKAIIHEIAEKGTLYQDFYNTFQPPLDHQPNQSVDNVTQASSPTQVQPIPNVSQYNHTSPTPVTVPTEDVGEEPLVKRF